MLQRFFSRLIIVPKLCIPLKLLALQSQCLIRNLLHTNLLPILKLGICQQILLQLFFMFAPAFLKFCERFEDIFLKISVFVSLLRYQIYVFRLDIAEISLDFQVLLEILKSSERRQSHTAVLAEFQKKSAEKGLEEDYFVEVQLINIKFEN